MMISDNYLIINPCTSAVLTLKREMSYCTQLWCIVYMQLGRHSKSASGEQCTQFEVLAGVHTPAWIYMIPYFFEFFKQSKTGGINIPLPQPGSFGVGLRCAVLWYLEDTSAPQEETQQFLSDHSIQQSDVSSSLSLLQQVFHLQEHRWRGKRHQNSLNSHFLRYVSCMHADRKVLLVCSAFLYPFCIFTGGLILRLRLANMTASSQHLILKMWRLMYNSNLPSSTFTMEHAHIQFMANFQYCSAFLTKGWNCAIVIKVCNVRGQL